jgi:hypothetical protein
MFLLTMTDFTSRTPVVTEHPQAPAAASPGHQEAKPATPASSPAAGH